MHENAGRGPAPKPSSRLARPRAAPRARAKVPAASLGLGLLALLALTADPSAYAAAFDVDGQDWEGLSQFVQLAEAELGTGRVITAPTLPLDALRREDGILLVHPTRALDVDELSAFMRAGGRLVLLDDYGTGDDLLTRFGIRRVPLPARPVQMLRDNPSLAIAEPTGAHPIVREAARVVTNHGTGLAHPGLSPLLTVRGNGEPDVLLGMAGAVGHGRLIAIGDGSVLINAMMRYPGNRALARGLVRYLVDDDVWGKREGKLYVLVNGFSTRSAFGDGSHAAGAVGEARRVLLDWVEGLRREGLSPAVAYVAALAVGLGIVAWTSARVGRAYRAASPRFARAVPVISQGGIAGHAAVLGSPEASRVLAVLEWKSALEEQLATRLGLERAPSHEELVAQARRAALLSEDDLRALGKLLAELARVEGVFARAAQQARPPSALERFSDARVLAIAARARQLLAAVRHPTLRGTVEQAP